jgi:hypothetical protein
MGSRRQLAFSLRVDRWPGFVRCHSDAWAGGRGWGAEESGQWKRDSGADFAANISSTTQIPHSHLATRPSFGMTPRSFSQTRRNAVAGLGMTPRFFLALVALTLLAALPLGAESPGDVVARLNGKSVIRADAPDGSTLLGLALRTFLDEFAKAKDVVVTAEDIAALNASTERGMARSREEWKRRVVTLRAELSSPDTPDRRQKEQELKTIESILTSLKEQDRFALAQPGTVKRAKEETAWAIVRSYRINQALWKEYGGRVIFQQFGPEPLDAYRKLLLQRQAEGKLKILDRSLESGFWKYVTDEKMHTFIDEDEGKKLMTTDWWLREAPAEESVARPSGPRIDGRRFTAGGLTIEPTRDCQWIEIVGDRGTRAFLCAAAGRNDPIRVTVGEGLTVPTLMTRAKVEAPPGSAISDAIAEKSDLPRKGSVRYHYTSSRQGSPTFHTFGYLWESIAVEITSEAASEPTELEQLLSAAN